MTCDAETLYMDMAGFCVGFFRQTRLPAFCSPDGVFLGHFCLIRQVHRGVRGYIFVFLRTAALKWPPWLLGDPDDAGAEF
jgi:hypothetical protein